MSNIRQYLSKIFKSNQESAPFLNAFLDGADETINHLEQYAEYAQDQLFFNTADAEYVFKLAARNGFFLPKNAGLNIEGLKPLAPIIINQPKTVLFLLNQLMEIYFSQPFLRPSVICAQPEPYRLNGKDDFIVKTREAVHRLTVDVNLFSNPKSVSASELSTYINSVQDHYLATVYFDRNINKNKIRITANGSGLNEIIQVMGGTLQNLLLFPDIVPTTNNTQTQWAVSKPASYSDIVTFRYLDGPIADVYKVSVGDIVTFRGQFDVGASGKALLPIVDEAGNLIIDNLGNEVKVEIDLITGNYSSLNGSFEVIDSGYDYFVIKNKFLQLPIDNQGLIVQLSSRDVIFTKNTQHRVYNQSAFSYLTEMTNDQITVTVPAVPPIVKRFLEGSWHIYGVKHSVLDFTRDSVKINPITTTQLPKNGNIFVLNSKKNTNNFFDKALKISTINPSSGIISLDLSEKNGLLPYTTPFFINPIDPFYCDIDSDSLIVNFSYRHGLFKNAKIVINGAEQNPENGLSVNNTWSVEKVLTPKKILIKLNEKNKGWPSSVTGTMYSLGNKKYRIVYASAATLELSKLNVVGKKFKLFDDGSIVVNNKYIWEKLKTRVHTITAVSSNSVEFETLENWSVQVNETIASKVKTQTTAVEWGGASATYYFDKNNEDNIELMSGTELIVADFIKPNSDLFLGSYIFDPQGIYYKFLPSSTGTIAASRTLKGESGTVLSVENATGFNPSGGYLIFEYGTNRVEGPIKYLTLSGNQIIIDPSYVFKKTHEIKATVRYVQQTEPFAPNEDGKTYQPFLTGTSLARDSFFEILKSVVSAGVFIQPDVLLPELRYADEALEPYE